MGLRLVKGEKGKTATSPRVAVGYARFSSRLQSPKSLDDQEAEIRAAAARAHVRLTTIHRDAAKSGASLVGRDGLERAIKAVEDGDAAEIWFWDLDRSARDEADWFTIYKRIEKAGGRIVGVVDGFDSAREEARMIGGFKAIIAAEERRKIGQRSSRGIRARLATGFWHGVTPYGYDREHVTDSHGRPAVKLSINRERAEVVRRIFTLSAEGVGAKSIAERLNAEKVPSPRGDGWRGGTICYMVRHVAPFVGRLRDGAARPELRIVSEELAQRARAAMGERDKVVGQRKANGQFGTGGGWGRSSYLLTGGFLRCPSCASGLWVRRGTYYVCGGHVQGRCDQSIGVPVEVADARVLEAVRKDVLSPDAIAYARARLEQEARSSEKAARGARVKLQRERSGISAKLRNLTSAVEAGADSIPQVVERMRELRERDREIEAQLAAPTEARSAAVALHPAVARKVLEGLLPLAAMDPKRARPILAKLLGDARLEVVRPAKGRPFYRAHFKARPAAVLLASGDLSIGASAGRFADPSVQVVVDLR